MKNSKETDLLEKVLRFKDLVLEKRPSKKQMIKDLSVMSFKIKPLSGDITRLKFDDPDFVYALWSLGKLEEFTFSQIKNLVDEEAEIFFKIVDTIRAGLEQKMGQASFPKIIKGRRKKTRFEVEIIREVETKIH